MAKHTPHEAAECPACFEELAGGDWWAAKPATARLVGLVVQRDDLPSVVEQRNVIAGFGVPIHNFRHPALESLEDWNTRLRRFFGSLGKGDVLVVTTVNALGHRPDEAADAIRELAARGVVVKVLSRDSGHLEPVATP